MALHSRNCQGASEEDLYNFEEYRDCAIAAFDAIRPLAAVVPRDQYANEPYIDDLDDLTLEHSRYRVLDGRIGDEG